MKRNYDSIAHCAQDDKTDYMKLKKENEQYEKELAHYKSENTILTTTTKE